MNIGGRGDGGSSGSHLRCASSANQSSTSSTKSVVAQAQVVVGDPAAAREQVEDELESSWWTYCGRSSNHCALAARRALRARHERLARGLVRGERGRDPVLARSAETSAIASSTASFVAEPIEKCAVCAASPSSTMLSWNQRSTFTVGKLSHLELFASSWWPSSSSREQLLQDRDALQVAVPRLGGRGREASKPARRQTSSRISTMKVDSPSS